MLCASTIFLSIISFSLPAHAVVPCNDTGTCEELLWKGSNCRDGFCTNPFERGCLKAMLESDVYSQKYSRQSADDSNINSDDELDMQTWRRRLLSAPRTCNSEDGPQAAEQGLCSENVNDYAEVRLSSQNWESAFVLSWMMQIIYSELLGVPSTIETGEFDKNVNFYDETNRMDYGKANKYEMFQRAYDAVGGDCSIYNEANKDASGDDYIPCAHAVMEVWATSVELLDAQKKGVAEPGQFMGINGVKGWHMTLSSIMKDPSLGNIYGMAGESNRQKLADTFKRPTTWRYYCNFISPNNCTTPNGVATRPPVEDGSEDGRYFFLGDYTGFFRATIKNDCNQTEACTGHFMDFPCGWSSYVKQQLKHLDVALESDGGEEISNGYAYTEMVEIWSAANATKSDLIGLWWSPDVTYNLYRGSGSDLIPVTLPAATQECVENRVDVLKRCDSSATEFELYGDGIGACGEPSVNLQKIAVGNMQSNIQDSTNPRSQMSPAYDVYKDFSITELQVADILSEWADRGQDKFNFDLRFATCKWMAENLDHIIQSVVPPTHPQTFAGDTGTNPLSIVALVFSAIAILLTIGTVCGMWYKHQQCSIPRAAQIEFLALLLVGLFLVSIGSLLLALEPSKWTCTVSIWMINIGYTTQLVPTMIRVSAIIKIVRASMKMKVVKVDRKVLLTRSIGFSVIAALYCAFWTIFDPPNSQASLNLSQDKNDFGETIVSVSNYCDSNSPIWFMVSFACQAFLLIGASVLAHQMRSAPNAVNDSQELAVMIYSSFIFLVLRFVVYIFSWALLGEHNSFQKARSLFCSIDTMANITIFFSRFFQEETNGNVNRSRRHLNFVHPTTNADAIDASRLADAHNHSTPIQTSKNLRRRKSSQTPAVKEEKEEEDSTTFKVRVNDISLVLPGWILEKYGEVENQESEQIVKTPTIGFEC